MKRWAAGGNPDGARKDCPHLQMAQRRTPGGLLGLPELCQNPTFSYHSGLAVPIKNSVLIEPVEDAVPERNLWVLTALPCRHLEVDKAVRKNVSPSAGAAARRERCIPRGSGPCWPAI